MDNTVYYWDSAVWGAAEFAKYQATWDNAVWGESDWGFYWLGKLEAIIDSMEKRSIGRCLGVPGLFYPGMDNFENPLRTIIKKME